MNQLKKAVVFLLLGVFVDELLGIPELWPNLGDNGHIIGLREDGGDPTIHVWCLNDKHETLKGLSSRGNYYCSSNPRCLHSFSTGNINKNSIDGRIDFVCPREGYISGIDEGYFFKDPASVEVRCCHDNHPRKGCFWVGWQNCFGRPFKFWVPDGYYMAGFRRKLHFDPKNIFSGVWDFYVCK
ncbi:uncharacterized protein LOC116305369 [Actinia tenebrosa]|uniref:Uncharacterized protein LOC116305369 n=1 Tax=Actinia tenebrosa TaxID=6105 RepID=A0A6P8IVU8_ACTTE|nr:uncharacterized protein LOC116305369 [Actinia tenebrosa]